MTGARRLAEFGTRLRFHNIPADVVISTKLHMLDVLGCGLAASNRGLAVQGREWALEQGAPARGAALLAHGGLAAPSEAALANGMLCHALDYDDTHPESKCHTSVVVGIAALAAAQATGCSGQDLITAIVAGTETVIRLGLVSPGAFHDRGLHPTAVCGAFGAAVAVSSLMSLDVEQATGALGLAGSTAAGLFEYLADGTPAKPFHAGWAAHAGVSVASLAARGAAGPATVLEGRFGLFQTLLGHDLTEQLGEQLSDLGERWETRAIAIKPYPACHFTHAAMDGIRTLREQGLRSDQVSSIEIGVASGALPIVAEPPERRLRPSTAHDGKFSLQFSTAAMLINGSVDLATYEPAALADPAVTDLASRIAAVAVDRGDRGPFFAIVAATLADGSVVATDVAHPTGTPQQPLSPAEVIDKFYANAADGRRTAHVVRLADAVLALDELASTADLDLTLDPDGK
jgi:2-methylcitrate dehydratase PrpD